MVRMTDLLKRAKMQVGVQVGVRKEEVPLEPPTEKEKPPLQPKEPPIAPPVAKEEPPRPIVPRKEEPIAREVKPLPSRPAVPEGPKPPEKEVIPERKEPPVAPAKGPVEFAGILGRARESLPAEDITQKFMTASVPGEEESRKLYSETLEFTKRIFSAYKSGGTINKEEVVSIANRLVNDIMLGSSELLKLFHELDSLPLYIYHNAVNVSVLSINIGMVFKYNKSTLIDLAIVGLLHDMDLVKSKEIIEKPVKLDERELKEIRRHPLNIATFADSAFNFKDDIVNAILQHHERRKGHGYPVGLSEGSIHDLAVIVGIADTYDAMTHSRPYKERMSPHAAILEMVNVGKDLFPNETVKALIACVGLYPVGSWVEINTGEIGKVIMTNYDFPLRPVVSILMDKDSKKFREVRTVDLRKMPSLYIKQAVEKKEI